MPVRLIGCGYFRSIILGVSFFFDKLFQSEILLFSKIKKIYFHAFFYEKMVSVFFPLKKYIDHFFGHFQIRKKLPFFTFFDLLNPFMTSK